MNTIRVVECEHTGAHSFLGGRVVDVERCAHARDHPPLRLRQLPHEPSLGEERLSSRGGVPARPPEVLTSSAPSPPSASPSAG